MRAIEFKSKLSKNHILIPRKIQAQLRNTNEKNVKVIILFNDSDDQEIKEYKIEEQSLNFANEELESINRGLKDFEEGKIHSHETVRKLYEKYL